MTVYLCFSKKCIEEITSFHANCNNLLIYCNLVTKRFSGLNVEITSIMGSPVVGHFNLDNTANISPSPSPEVVGYIFEVLGCIKRKKKKK